MSKFLYSPVLPPQVWISFGKTMPEKGDEPGTIHTSAQLSATFSSSPLVIFCINPSRKMAIYACAPGHLAGGSGRRCQGRRAVGAPWRCPLARCAECCWSAGAGVYANTSPTSISLLRVASSACSRAAAASNADEEYVVFIWMSTASSEPYILT